MVRAISNKSSLPISQIIDRVLAATQVSRGDHLQLTSAILSDVKITDEERRQINRIFDAIQAGGLKIVD